MSFGDYPFSANTFGDVSSSYAAMYIIPSAIGTEYSSGLAQFNFTVLVPPVQVGEIFGPINVAQDQIVLVGSVPPSYDFGTSQFNLRIHQSNPTTGEVGSIQTGEIFGSINVRYNQYVQLGPVQTNATFGTLRVIRTIKPGPLPASRLGIPELSFLQTLQPGSISSAESFGQINIAFAQYLQPVEISSLYSSGLHVFQLRIKVPPSGTGKAFGLPRVLRAGVARTLVTSSVLAPVGMATPVVKNLNFIKQFFFFGYGQEVQLSLGPVVLYVGRASIVPSIQTGEQLGEHTIYRGRLISPVAIPGVAAFGVQYFKFSAVQLILPISVGTNNRLTAKLIAIIRPVAITSAAAFGNPTTSTGVTKIIPGSIAGFTLGGPSLQARNTIVCGSLPATTAVGVPKVYSMLVASSLPSTQVFGTPSLRISSTLYVYSAQFSSGSCLGLTAGDRLGIGQPTVSQF